MRRLFILVIIQVISVQLFANENNETKSICNMELYKYEFPHKSNQKLINGKGIFRISGCGKSGKLQATTNQSGQIIIGVNKYFLQYKKNKTMDWVDILKVAGSFTSKYFELIVNKKSEIYLIVPFVDISALSNYGSEFVLSNYKFRVTLYTETHDNIISQPFELSIGSN